MQEEEEEEGAAGLRRLVSAARARAIALHHFTPPSVKFVFWIHYRGSLSKVFVEGSWPPLSLLRLYRVSVTFVSGEDPLALSFLPPPPPAACCAWALQLLLSICCCVATVVVRQ